MKAEKNKIYFKSHAKIVLTILPVVIVMCLIFIFITKSEFLRLSRDKLTLETENCAENINQWTEQTLNELQIYMNIIEKTSSSDEQTLAIIQTSCDVNDAYPYGLYVGDENGTYLDGSGWDPYEEYGEDEFIVTERNWYLEGLEHDKITFGEPYADAMTGDVCVSATSKIHYKPAVSVISADIYMNYVDEIVASATSGSIETAFCITGNSRVIITDSDSSMTSKSLNKYDSSILYNNINSLINSEKTGQYKIYGDNNRKYYVNIQKLKTNDWYLVTCVSRNKMLSEMRHMEYIMLFIGLIATIILTLTTVQISKEMSEIRKKAKTDPLTRLLNRNGFRENVMTLLETNPEQGLLIIIDMDNFKLVNDQLGHPEGDKVLKRLAELLEGYFNRNKDIVARIGGDEFAVYVGRHLEAEESEAMLRKFISVFHNTFDELYPKQKLSISCGGAYTKSCGGIYEELYHKSDIAMYEVKKNGKDNFIIS